LKDEKDYKIKALKREILINNLKVIIVGIILVTEIVLIGSYLSSLGFIKVDNKSKNRVAVINYNQEVTEAFTTKIMEKLDEIRKDKSYKSVLFIMNSPGGSPTASEELSEYLKDFQKDKNITMYIQSIAASGGYYIASAIKPIYANKNAIVGSIGVVMPHYNLEELAKRVGIEEDYLTAGEFKKPISFLEKIDEKNREYIKKHLLEPTYKNFIESVAKNREITVDRLKPFTDGKIYIANMADIKDILVDKISSLYMVKRAIKNSLGVKDLEFVDINLDEKKSFLPEIKVGLELKPYRGILY
jgi:protease-4